jgi:hypothetical protein
MTDTNSPHAHTPREPASRKGQSCLIRIALLAILFLSAIFLFKDELPGLIERLITGFKGVTLTPTSTPTPRPTFTPTLTRTPQPTRTPYPSPTPTPAPVEVTFDTIGDYPVEHLVILVGRLDLMGGTTCTSSNAAQKCGLLLENPANPDQKITIFVWVGESPNTMKPLPDSYTKSDIQVRLNDGSYAVVGYRLRVQGRVCTTTENNPCITNITKIELVQVR